jgi:RHS repeat-associated protein
MPTTTNYIWDDENLLAEADATNTINTVYTNEPRQYGNLASSRISGTTRYHHFDAIGSTRQLTNSAGSVTDTMIYDAWGNVVNRTGTAGIVFLWIGILQYYFDVETGQIYVRERVYAPPTGRWTAKDPLARFLASVAIAVYVYASNQGLLLVDPSGLADDTLPPCPRNECQKCVNKAMKDDKAILELTKWLQAKPPYNKIKDKKVCAVPKPICCGSTIPPESEKRPECDYCTGIGAGPSRKGKFYPAEKGADAMIVVCAAFAGDPTGKGKGWDVCTAVVETLRHELWHAAAACGPWPEKPEDKCTACLCDEMFAYATSGQCLEGSVWFKYAGAKLGFKSPNDCVIESAASSCNSECAGDVKQLARDLFDQKKCQFGGGLATNVARKGAE